MEKKNTCKHCGVEIMPFDFTEYDDEGNEYHYDCYCEHFGYDDEQ